MWYNTYKGCYVIETTDLISEERKLELEKEIEKELSDLKNNIITRSDFVLYIYECYEYKKYNIVEVIYIIDTFLNPIKLVIKQINLTAINQSIINSYIDDMYNIECDSRYNYKESNKSINPKITDLKRLPRIENMAIKAKKVKKKKK